MFGFVGLSIWAIGILAIRLYQQQIITHDPNAGLFEINAYLIPDEQLGWKNCINCTHHHPAIDSPRCSKPGFCKSYELGPHGNRITRGTPERFRAKRSIWVVGDSSAFGLGVEGEETFSERLRIGLRDRGVDVVNLAVVGYNTYQIYLTILNRLEGAKEPPDMIIVWGGFNDLEFSREFFSSDIIPTRVHFWVVKRNIKKILALCGSAQIPVVINTIPSREKSMILSQYRDWLVDLGDEDSGVMINDVRKRFQSETLPSLYSDYDSIFGLPKVFHPGPKGHRIVSEMLREIVDRALLEH